jgi:acetyl esterase/lipase
MPSDQALEVNERLRARSTEAADLAARREAAEQREAFASEPAGVQYEQPDGVDGLWVTAADTDRGALLYLHGGGYVMGSPEARRKSVGHLVRAARLSALVPRYRRAPEHAFPAAVDDAVAAYRWLLDRGHAPERLVIGGDSAGGGLAIAAALRLRDEGAPLPAGLLAISPWIDLTCESEFYETRREADLMVTREALVEMAEHYLAGADPAHPLASPIYGELSGLPPLFVAAGSDEILLDDSLRLARSAAIAGVELTLRVDAGMQHIYHVFVGYVPEADAAVAAIGAWIAQRVGEDQRGLPVR